MSVHNCQLPAFNLFEDISESQKQSLVSFTPLNSFFHRSKENQTVGIKGNDVPRNVNDVPKVLLNAATTIMKSVFNLLRSNQLTFWSVESSRGIK